MHLCISYIYKYIYMSEALIRWFIIEEIDIMDLTYEY